MHVASSTTQKKSWQGRRRPVSVLAEMALRRERVVQRLTDLRERHGLSQEDAAHKVGVTHRQWQRWEAGESMPYPRNLDGVASAFGISIQEFFDDQPLPPDPVQLDRVEAKLDELLGLLRPKGPAEALEAEADRIDAMPPRNGAKPRRKRKTAEGP